MAKTKKSPAIHYLVAFVIWALFKFVLKAPEPMTDLGLEIVGIFILTCYLWITTETGYTSLLCICLVAISGAMSGTNAVKASFGDWMFSFLMGCMLLSIVLQDTGLSKRIAMWFITRPFVKGRPWLIVLMFFMAMFVLGLGMTSSGTLVLFWALGRQILETCGYTREDKFSQLLMCMCAWLTIFGNGMTAIGHGNFITGMGWVGEAFGLEITIAQSAAIGMSVGFLWMVCMILILKFVYKADASKLVSLNIDELRASVPPMKKEEKIVAVIAVIVIFMWVANDLLKNTPLAPIGKFCKSLGTGMPLLIAAVAFSMIRVEGKPILEFNSALKRIAWQGCMMIATVRMLGTLFSDEAYGIVAWVEGVFGPMVANVSDFAFIVICIGVVVLVTSLVSNSVAMVLFKVAAPLIALHPGIVGPALGVCMITAAHAAFWTPACTTTTSFIVGTGDVKSGFMVKYGWLPEIVALLLLVFVGYNIGVMVF